MDSCTFGDTQSAINLVNILSKSENEKFVSRGSRILAKYLKSLKSLSCIPDKDTRETAYKLWRNHFIERVDNSEFPLVINSHIKCVIVGQYRKAMRLSS